MTNSEQPPGVRSTQASSPSSTTKDHLTGGRAVTVTVTVAVAEQMGANRACRARWASTPRHP